MADIAALMNTLPVSGLEPQSIALIEGLIYPPRDRSWMDNLTLLEPPANRHEPYIEPVRVLKTLLESLGYLKSAASDKARTWVAQMRSGVADEQWVNFLTDEPDSPECLPALDFVGWLRDRRLPDKTVDGEPDRELKRSETQRVHKASLFTHMLDFIEQTASAASAKPIFEGWSEPGDLLSLKAMHALPSPSNMVEFLPGAPWLGPEVFGTDDPAYEPFLRWRESMRTVAPALTQAWGKEVYYFADLNCEIDDDYVHRFLALHWCCTYKPECAYVRYLVKVSKARDVEELKAALVDEVNYAKWFDLRRPGPGPDARMCRYEYLGPMGA